MGGATFGATEPWPMLWGMASIDEVERGESGLESSVINREAKLHEPLGVLLALKDKNKQGIYHLHIRKMFQQ
jgi:hypothetical protein